MARTIEEITQRVESLRRASADRDQRWNNVHDVRSGDIDTVIPGSMPDAWPKPIVANLIDTSARDTAEVMGTMPSINCSTGTMTSDRSKKFSSKKTKVANYYVQASGLNAGRQIVAADHYGTYGMLLYVIEPDFEEKRPHIRVENPMGVYPEFDMFGRLKSYTKVYKEPAIRLVQKFSHIPNLLRLLQGNNTGRGPEAGWSEREIELVKYIDDERMLIYMPNHGNMALMSEVWYSHT